MYEALRRLRPNAKFSLMQDGSHHGEVFIASWDGAVEPPGDAEIAAMIVTIEAERAQAETAERTEREQLLALLAKLDTTDLDAPERRRVLRFLLRRALSR